MPCRPVGVWDVEELHFLGNWLTYGGEIVSLTRRQQFNHKDFVHIPVRGSVEPTAGRIRSIENNSMTSLGIKHAVSRLVVPQLSTILHARYEV
jgi:hypothetical protein